MIFSARLSEFKMISHAFCLESEIPKSKKVIMPVQIHSNSVAVLQRLTRTKLKGLDGLVTQKKLFIGVKTADCLPVLFFDPKTETIAAVHAGWKGLMSNILVNSAEMLHRTGADLKTTIAVIGPHIRSCSYEVEKKRVEAFQHRLNITKISENRLDKWFLDLEKIAEIQLKRAGLLGINIETMKICTYCSDTLPSYRRLGKKAGRMVSYIGLKKG